MNPPAHDLRRRVPTLVLLVELEFLPRVLLASDSEQDELRLRLWLARARESIIDSLEDALDELVVEENAA